MRPIKLTMTAFGPYKDRQVIDFTEIEDHSLFVIAGKTGAGKTTIFDAICFALYGEANGEDRSETRLLRSDFADDDTYTSVELEFRLRDRVYRVVRELAHVKRGRKTPSGGKTELYDLTTGTAVPVLDKFYKREVDRKLVELIGLDKDQFTQIVMLPQGEFRKLLTSETDNKEKILRRIFKTDPYKQIVEFLDQRRKAALSEAQNKRELVQMYMEQIKTTLVKREDSALFALLEEEHYSASKAIDELAVEIDFYARQEEETRRQADEAYNVYKQKEAAFHAAEALNKRFDQLDGCRARLNELERREEEIKTKEERLKLAEQASFLRPYEQQRRESEQRARQREEALREKTIALRRAQSKLEEAEQIFAIESGKEEQRERVKREVRQLEEWLPLVQALDDKRQFVKQLDEQRQEAMDRLRSQDERLQALRTKAEEAERWIRQAEEETSALSDWRKKEMDAAAKQQALRQYAETTEHIAALRAEADRAQRAFQDAQRSYEQLESEWLANQASMLAETLRDGECCPVCGSREHPRKAERTDAAPTKEQFERVKEERDRRASEREQARARLVAAQESERQQREQIEPWGGSLEQPWTAFEQARAERAEAAENVRRLEQLSEQLADRRQKLRALQDEIADRQKERAVEQERLQALAIQYTEEKAKLDAMIANIPDEARSLDRLRERLEKARREAEALERDWARARERTEQARLQMTRAESEKESAEQQFEEAKQQAQKKKESFERELTLAGFPSESAYEAAQLSFAEQEQLRADIRDYRTNLDATRAQTAALETELAGQQRTDMEALHEETQTWRERYDQRLRDVHQWTQIRQNAVRLKNDLSKAYNEYLALEEKARAIVNVHDLTRGDNEYRVSFERYLQIAYLESIIEAANVRLLKMTNGQFQLDRRTDREARGRQSGLGLDVLDAYTGQYRDVKSLSGGEKFKASLCLALGLSDVIQARDGGISIETMFIDEGFGSLDEESLQEAIDILIELKQSGRLIGVISHVQELKDAIPAVLEARKTKEGYSRARFNIR